MKFETFNLVTWLTILFSPIAWSVVPFNNLPCRQSGYAKGVEDLYQEVRVYGKDDRLAMSKFAQMDGSLTQEDLAQIRSSLGYVICEFNGKKMISSGTLISNGTVLTAAHAFLDIDGNFYEPLSNCFFRNQERPPKVRRFAISEAGIHGLKVGKDYPRDLNADWAVAKLSEPINEAKPFALDMSNDKLAAGDSTYHASAYQQKMKNNDPTQAVMQKCNVLRVVQSEYSQVYSGCDADHGASGGIHFIKRNGLLVAKAISVDGGFGRDGDQPNLDKGESVYSVGIDGSVLREILRWDPTISKSNTVKPTQGI